MQEYIRAIPVTIEDGMPVKKKTTVFPDGTYLDASSLVPGTIFACKSEVFEGNDLDPKGNLIVNKDGTIALEYWQEDIFAEVGEDDRWHFLEDGGLRTIARARNREMRDAFIREHFAEFQKFKAHYMQDKHWD